MSAGTFVFDVISALIISGYLLYSYSDWFRQRIAVTLAVLVAWYFSFLIVLVLPLDISATAYYSKCANYSGVEVPTHDVHTTTNVITEKEINATRTGAAATTLSPATSLLADECDDPPRSLLQKDVLPNLWRVVYWSSQLLTWFVLPLMQSYTQAGEFTVLGKLRSALWDNMIYYASLAFIAVILIIYIALQPNQMGLNWERTKAIAAAASNTWGLFVLVLMLGYGLVEVPRNLWLSTKRGYQLNRAYFKVAKLMSERTDAEESVDEVLISINAVSNVIGTTDLRRPQVEEILKKIPMEMMDRIKRRRVDNPFTSDPPTEKTLIKLHRQVIKALQDHHRTEAQWSDMTNAVFELEDVNRNMISNEHYFKHTLSRPPASLLTRTVFNPTVEWYWKCLVSPILLRVAAGTAVIMSIMIVWSEVTFFCTYPPLSLFAVFVGAAKEDDSYVALELICLVTICYLSLCTYYTVFKIRVFNYYYLASNHQSDEYTLLFSGALLCRLTPPLCLNFLSLIHMDSHVIDSQIEETAYTRIMGHMDVVSIVSDYFNIYFPIALLALTLATYFSLGARFLSMLGFQQFLNNDSELTHEMVEEGKEHIKRERRRVQRMIESASRRREFANRFGGGDGINGGGGDGADYSGGRIDDDDGDGNLGGAAGASNPRLYRQSDIVKPRSSAGPSGPQQQVTSPERSLLRSGNGDFGYGYVADSPSKQTETVDLSPPARQTAGARSPPRNIFDDL